jgi:cytochrome P450
LINTDPPEQQQWRRVLNPYFTARSVEKLEPGTRTIVTALIDAFIETGQADLVTDFCNELPGTVFFTHFVPVPLQDLAMVRDWIEAITFPRDYPEEASDSFSRLTDYVYRLLNLRRHGAAPNGDLLDAILSARIQGKKVSLEQAMMVVMILLHAGLETTASGLANALYFLGTQPAERRWLLENGENRFATAIEELIRHSASLHGVPRIVRDDAEVSGVQFRKGDKVLLAWAAGNRDPHQFEEATRCVLDRDPNPHLGFGVGPHRCLGNHLARQSIRVSLEEILRRLPDYHFERDHDLPLHGYITRGFTSLPTLFTPGPRLGSS